MTGTRSGIMTMFQLSKEEMKKSATKDANNLPMNTMSDQSINLKTKGAGDQSVKYNALNFSANTGSVSSANDPSFHSGINNSVSIDEDEQNKTVKLSRSKKSKFD